MKKTTLILFLQLFAIASVAQVKTVQVTVRNDWTGDKVHEPVVVKLPPTKKVGFDVKSTKVTCHGQDVPCQLDDMDGDLRSDEVFFLADIKAGETKVFDVTLMAKEQGARGKEQEDRIYTALQLRDKQDKHPDVHRVEAPGKSNIFNDIYMHGITIESELTGYRIYFDARQNIDLYGKKYRRIELPETQFYTSAEQLAQGYGVDVLWAGQAIGCGSFKDYQDNKPQNWSDVAIRGQRVVTSGSLRTVVEVYDLGVKAEDGTTYDMHQYYSLYAGHRDLQVDVLFDRPLSKPFCTGVQKVGVNADEATRQGHTPEGIVRPDGIAASWGCDYPDMGKKQQWPPEAIGMAVYVPTAYIRNTQESDLNYLFVVQPDKDNAIHYHLTFCADKEAQGYHTAKDWFASLDEWKEGVSHPVKVRVK
ncbi:MAG: DUF4861 domain-containing protein [Bacteroidaceae bacterium]|nr:DUF4861 domain-containing protein [Bacteroidaceae bacterium]